METWFGPQPQPIGRVKKPGTVPSAVHGCDILSMTYGLFRVLSGRRSQIEFPTVEVDGVDEVLLIAETARRGLDPLNP